MNDELYHVDAEPSIQAGTVLVHALTGFVDAGQAGDEIAAELGLFLAEQDSPAQRWARPSARGPGEAVTPLAQR
ncbi:MAG: hypothetical protein ACRDR6_28550 [Pseudonocardiaceae bacterium]